MTIYERPTKSLMADRAKASLKPGQTFPRADAVRWFAQHYPKIKPGTVSLHVEHMAINSPSRKHFPNVRPGSGHDLFFKVGSDRYRLWDPETDPAPSYKDDLGPGKGGTGDTGARASYAGPDSEEADEEETGAAATAFAFERDLRGFLARNLSLIEPGLQLYEEEGIGGEEFPAGGRFIDILAVDKEGGYVVVELKVSRGYDRALGQLLRYMTWVEQNMGPARRTRGFIVAREITDDLKLAAARVADVRLIEYRLSFELRPV
jgi:hypothetical protein